MVFNLILILPLTLAVAACIYVIWRGLRRPPPQPKPGDQSGEPTGLSGGPAGGGDVH